MSKTESYNEQNIQREEVNTAYFSNTLQRSHTCGDLSSADNNKQVTLNGWVHRIRNHGGVHFINIRDRYGLIQVVVDDKSSLEAQTNASKLHQEYCVCVCGSVRLRPDDMKNKNMPNGDIEVHTQDLHILSVSKVLPFMVEETRNDANEDLRLKHRYIDLRSGDMQKSIILRNTAAHAARNFLHKNGFLEIETPTLIRSTPEGARDFLVPSRILPGNFYALAQSPQLYKQILMVSGLDKYYQFAHCYRDEDARGDRQPEHTQIDIEMSFPNIENIYSLTESLMSTIFKETLNLDIKTPFLRLTYDNAMNTYGSDKPDLRFGLELQDVSNDVSACGFGVFENTIASGGVVKLLRVPADIAQGLSRKHINELEEVAKTYKAKGLAWTRVENNNEIKESFTGGIGKFLNEHFEIESSSYVEFKKKYSLEKNDLLLFVADTHAIACTALGAIRNALAKLANLIPNNTFSFAWVTDFPLFEWDEDNQRWSPAHHMFTMPQEQYLDTLETSPGDVKGQLYDLVCNGMEIASGSIRIHQAELQERIFKIIGMPSEEAHARFGFLLEALQYGAPPHGGIAPGFDRLMMIIRNATTIRDVMAFPKNTQGMSPMDGCPNVVDTKQLDELGIVLKK